MSLCAPLAVFSAVAERAFRPARLEGDELLLQAADQGEMADRLLAIADARDVDRATPCRRAIGWDRSWRRRRPFAASRQPVRSPPA